MTYEQGVLRMEYPHDDVPYLACDRCSIHIDLDEGVESGDPCPGQFCAMDQWLDEVKRAGLSVFVGSEFVSVARRCGVEIKVPPKPGIDLGPDATFHYGNVGAAPCWYGVLVANADFGQRHYDDVVAGIERAAQTLVDDAVAQQLLIANPQTAAKLIGEP